MLYNITSKKKIVYSTILLSILTISIFFQNPWLLSQLNDSRNNNDPFLGADVPQTSETDYYSQDWITNGQFSSGSVNWTSEITGDTSDFTLGVSGGAANYVVEGNTGTFNLIQNPLNNDDGKWVNIQDPYFPTVALPTENNDDSGLWIRHYFQEGTSYQQVASKVWARNCTLPQNLSDYTITSASLSSYFNATVNRNIDVWAERFSLSYWLNFDFAQFFLLLTDLDRDKVFQAGFFQLDNSTLAGTGSGLEYVSDTLLPTVSDETLKYYLTEILSQDYQNFTIAFGIRVFCEDNISPSDNDYWEELVFKSVSLSFTYEKKIDKLSKASWEQYGDTIPSTYEIENATLNFQYQTDKDWTTNTGSLNSEFRIIINNNQLGETVKLTTATTSPQYFKAGGLDVSSLIQAGEEVNLSIQIYIGDEFTLDTDVTLSIDNVTLVIGYGIYTAPDSSDYDLILNGVDRTTEKSTQVTYNENLNVTFIYKNSTGDFITGANVELTGGGLSPIPLSEGANQYYSIINSTVLGVGITYLTLTASKRYHTSIEFQITITVVSRDTELQLFLNDVNETIDKEIEIQWNENLNITIKYLDIESLPSTHIEGATVELTGAGPTKTLSEDPANQQYERLINTNILGVGSTFLTVYASLENYTSLSIRFKVTVSSRATYIDNVLLNETVSTSIQVPWNELFDISASYNDSVSNSFISGATVELIGPGYSQQLSESGNEYTKTINSSDFTVGNNLLTILAQKDNYSIASQLVTITVIERDTSLDIYLDEVLRTAITLPYAELLNITAIYKDTTGYFLDGATVELRSGGTFLDTLSPHPTYDQYNLTINTDQLILGVNSLVVYAKKDNYSASLASITITVGERNATLDIYLDEILRTAITLPYAEPLNITAIYKDTTGYFLDGAVVELRLGGTTLDTLSPHPTYDQYYLTINTDQLSLGVNLLAIYAKKDNYSAALTSIVITVNERDTTLDIYLEETQATSIVIDYGESLNITAIYEDLTGYTLDSAVVELRSGATKLYDFLYDPLYGQYYRIVNTNEFNLGANLLFIYAQQDNYTAKLVSITVTVNERDTYLEVLLDGLDSTTFEFYNISINEYLNITAIYNDFTDVFIDNALVQVSGSGITRTLLAHPTLDQYNYTLNAEDLGIGVHFLVISAEKENYSTSVVNIKLNILERKAYLQLFVNQTDITSTRYFEAEIDQILNITVQFRDIADDSHLSLADIRLTGALEENFTEVLVYEQYNVSILSNNLGQGINFLTIFAQKAGYKSESILFTIEVKEKASNLELFLNSQNKTLDKSIEVTIGEFINITVVFEDYTGLFIDNATVIIVGEGISLNLTKHPTYNQYNLTLDSDDLNFGINFLTLYAQKVNYQPKTFIIKIEIIEKDTDLHIYMEYDGILYNKTIDRTLSIAIRKLLNITVNYFDNESETAVQGATVQLVGEGLTWNLTENPFNHQYSVVLNTSELDLGVRFLTVYCQRPNYQSYTALLRIQVNRINTNVSTITGETVFNLAPRQDLRLMIRLTDLDFNMSVLNATVRYTWAYYQGELTDEDNDGVYEALLTNLPVGTFIVTITVYAGDDYEFERFQVTLNIVRPPENVLLFQILTIAGTAAAIGVSGYLIAYQKVLKYPKQVRKIHKFKSKLKKKKPLAIEVSTRDELIEKYYSEEINALEKQTKKKLSPKLDKTETNTWETKKPSEIEPNSP